MEIRAAATTQMPQVSPEKAGGSRAVAGGGDAQSYLQGLAERFPHLNLSLGEYQVGTTYNPGKSGNVMISPKYAAKAAKDPKEAAAFEEKLKGIPAAEEWLRGQVKAMGAELVASGTVVDENGDFSSWSETRTVREGASGSDATSLLKKKKKGAVEESATEKAKEAEAQRLGRRYERREGVYGAAKTEPAGGWLGPDSTFSLLA